MGGADLDQWMGHQAETITVAGSVRPEIQLPGMFKLAALREWARTGYPLPFPSGTGMIAGRLGIEAVGLTNGEIERWGIPGEITFEIDLVRV